MSVSVTYNSQSLAPQLGKIRYAESYDRATFSAEFAVAPSSLATVLAALNKWDKELAFTSSSFSRTHNVSNAVAIRTSAEKIGTMLDSAGNSRVRFTAIVERRADNAGDNGFREWSATCTENEQGVKTLTVNALVTADSGGAALANAEGEIDTIGAAFMSLYSLTAADLEEPVVSFQDLDRHNNIVRVTKTWSELFEVVNQAVDGSTETRNANLVFVDWEISRTTQEERGFDEQPVEFYNLRWRCLFKKGFSFSDAAVEGQFLALVIKRLKAQFGGASDPVLVGASAIRFSSTRNSAAGDWTFRVAPAGLILYEETLELDLHLMDFVKTTDGGDFTGEFVTDGQQGAIIQHVTVVQQDGAPIIPAAPALADFGGSPQLGLTHLNIRRGRRTAGRSVGVEPSASRSARDYSAVFTATWMLRARPESSPIGDAITGPTGNFTARDLVLLES